MKERTPISAKREPYDSDLTDAQWSVTRTHASAAQPTRQTAQERPARSRQRPHLRPALRMLLAHAPHDLPSWQTVYAYFRTWKSDETLKRIHDALRAEVRRDERGGYRQPERENHGIGGEREYDSGKNVNGRKRHVIVDTQGLTLEAAVHPADIQNRDGAKLALEKLAGRFPGLRLIWADRRYAGKLADLGSGEGGLRCSKS